MLATESSGGYSDIWHRYYVLTAVSVKDVLTKRRFLRRLAFKTRQMVASYVGEPHQFD